MTAPRPLSLASWAELFEKAEKTGQPVRVETKRTIVTILPKPEPAPVNPADLIDP